MTLSLLESFLIARIDIGISFIDISLSNTCRPRQLYDQGNSGYRGKCRLI